MIYLCNLILLNLLIHLIHYCPDLGTPWESLAIGLVLRTRECQSWEIIQL